MALFMDLGKYNLTYVVPAQACRGKAGRGQKDLLPDCSGLSQMWRVVASLNI